MPRILKVNPTGFFSYGRHDTIEIDNLGLTYVEGRNFDRDSSGSVQIGAGKTSLFNTVLQLIYGKSESNVANDKVTNLVAGIGRWGLLEFIDDHGVRWRVINTSKWKSDEVDPSVANCRSDVHDAGLTYCGTEVYLEMYSVVDDRWIDERVTNSAGTTYLRQKETQDKVAQKFGISYNSFVTSSYIAQKSVNKFLTGTHKDRIAILSSMVDLDRWDVLVQKVKADIEDITAKAVVAEANATSSTVLLDSVSAKLLSAEDAEDIILKNIADLELKVARCEEIIRSCTNTIKTHSAVDYNKEIMSLNKDLMSLQLAMSEKIESKNKTERKYLDLETSADSQVSDAKVAELRGQINTVENEKSYLKTMLDNLLASSGVCSMCMSVVEDAHIARHSRSLNDSIQLLENNMSNLNAELFAAINERSFEISRIIQDINREHKLKIEAINKEIADISSIASTTETKLQATLFNYESSRKIVSDAQKSLDISKDSMSQYMLSLSKHKERLSVIKDNERLVTELKNRIETSTNEARQLRGRLLVLAELVKIFGDKGVKSLIVSSTLDEINVMLSKYMSKLTNGSMSVRIEAFRNKKTDDLSVADVSVYVTEGKKVEVPVEGYSGGETEQISFGLCMAFMEYCTSRGKQSNLMLIDEAFTSIDRTSMELALSLLSSMSKTVNTIMIISHDPKIQNNINFDSVVAVTKKGHISTAEVM